MCPFAKNKSNKTFLTARHLMENVNTKCTEGVKWQNHQVYSLFHNLGSPGPRLGYTIILQRPWKAILDCTIGENRSSKIVYHKES